MTEPSWLTFTDANNKGTPNTQNQVFFETYSKLAFKLSFHSTEWIKREETSVLSTSVIKL